MSFLFLLIRYFPSFQVFFSVEHWWNGFFCLTNYTVNVFLWADCKLGYFCWYFFNQYSSVLLVMISVEKCIVVYFPLKVKNICTVKTAKWACLVAAFIIAAFNSQWFFIIEARSGSCLYTEVSESYVLVYNRIDSIIYSFGPFAIMGLTNICIIYKLYKSQMLQFTFLLLKTILIVRALLHIPKTLNHGINAVMYCIVGSRFRQELIELISCRKKKLSGEGRGSVTETGSTNLTMSNSKSL